MSLVNIGFMNYVNVNKIITVTSSESAPMKRIIKEARDRGMLVDATYGRRNRSVIVTDSDQVILSSVVPETIAKRIASKDELDEDPLDEDE